MVRILDVPYRSQWDDDANKSRTDCGPACLAMMLGYYGIQASINELWRATGVAPGKYVGFGQLQRVARARNVTFKYSANHKLNDLKRWIDEGKPVIALVKYSYWSQIEPGASTQDAFTGPHFVVVVGYGDGNIFINDPNYWPPRRQEGHNKAWSEVLFNLAWSNVRTAREPNPNNSVIAPTARKIDAGESSSQPEEPGSMIEYTVQPGDSWSSLAIRFLGDPTRFPEILAFNNLEKGARLRVGARLRIPITPANDAAGSPDRPIVLGEGAVQIVDAELVRELKEIWVRIGRLAADVDEAAALRAFLNDIVR